MRFVSKNEDEKTSIFKLNINRKIKQSIIWKLFNVSNFSFRNSFSLIGKISMVLTPKQTCTHKPHTYIYKFTEIYHHYNAYYYLFDVRFSFVFNCFNVQRLFLLALTLQLYNFEEEKKRKTILTLKRKIYFPLTFSFYQNKKREEDNFQCYCLF